MRSLVMMAASMLVGCGSTVVGEWESQQPIQQQHNRMIVEEELVADATVWIFRTVDGEQVAQSFTFNVDWTERQEGEVYSFEMNCDESPFGSCDPEDDFRMRCDFASEEDTMSCEADDSERWEAYEFSWRKLED